MRRHEPVVEIMWLIVALIAVAGLLVFMFTVVWSGQPT